MISFIIEAILFIMFILLVNIVTFTVLTLFIGKFFNVTMAQDSVFATMLRSFRKS